MKKSFCTKIGASLTLALALAAYAQPANDNCATAEAIAASGSYAFDMTGGTTEHVPACGFAGANDVWYSVDGGATGMNVVMSTCGSVGFDTILDAFDSCGGTQVACLDDSCGLQTSISVNIPASTTYVFGLSGYNGSIGAGSVSFTLTPSGSGPANDNCVDAVAVTNGSSTPFSNFGATTDGAGTCGGYANDIWYSYTAAGNEAVTVDLCGSAYDTVVAVFDGCGGTQVACLDDFCGLQTQLTFQTGGAGTFLIGIGGYFGSQGTGTMNLSSVPIVPPANDTCVGATEMFDGDNNWDNSFASQDVQISCAFGGPGFSGDDVWYYYTAVDNDPRNFEVTSYYNGDSTLAIYDVCGGTELACNDDFVGLLSKISNFPVASGTTYVIRLSGWNVGEGAGVLNIAVTPPPVPFDSCELAVPVAGQPQVVSYDTSANTTDATNCIGGLDGWYAWTPTISGAGVATTCGLTGSDTTLGAYDACGGFPIACVDDACGLQTTISFSVNANQTYLIRIAGYANQAVFGDLSLDVALPPANDDCGGATAAVIGSNAFDSTAASSDGLYGSCNFGGAQDTHDVWFDYTGGAEAFITLDTFGSAIGDTTMQVYDACAGTEIACNDDAGGGLQSQICNVPVVTGTHYFIRVASWGAGSNGGSGTVNIAVSTGGASFDVPPGAITEPGNCDDDPAMDLNGGCNVTPNAYTQLNLCDTYHGTASASLPNFFRDTDWYLFTLDVGDTVTVTGQTQFLAFTAILNNDCNNIQLLATAFPDPACNGIADYTMSATLDAGNYVVFMAPQFGAPNSCGNNDQYWFHIEGSGGCNTLVCNDIDFNNDGSFFDPQDIDAFLSVYSEGDCIPTTATCDDIDFNNDTSVFDPCDIDSFLLVFSEGPCTACGV